MKNNSIFSNLKGDFFGGITAGIVALPLALAFGVQSGLGASAGLYGAIFIGIFAAIFGGTSTQISGPTAPMTVVSAIMIAKILQINDGNLEAALPAILLIFILGGLLQVLLGILGFGKYVKYIPYPVVSGFMTGIGVIILITQIFPLVGYNPSNDQELINQFKPEANEILLDKILKEEAGEGLLVLEDFEQTIERASKITEADILLEAKTLVKSKTSGVIGSLSYFSRAIKNINWLELALALSTIFIIYGFKRITKVVPSTLVALLSVSLVAVLFNLEVRNISDIGSIPSGFPLFHFEIFTGFQLDSILPYLGAAVTLAVLGAIDSLLTSVVADNMTKTKHDSNRELIGQGIGNAVAGLFGGIPGAGATIRTVVNINSGGKTKLSGIVHGLILLFVLLALGPYASQIPLSVLAGILFTVGFGVMDYRGLRALKSMPITDAVILLTVLALTVFVDLIQAVGVGLILATFIFMKKMSDATAEDSSVNNLVETDKTLWQDETKIPEDLKKQIYIKHINGPLFFGYTSDFEKLAKQIPLTASHLIIRMERVPYMDQSGLYAFEEVLLTLARNKIDILLVGLQTQPAYRLKSIDIIPDIVPDAKIFKTFEEAIQSIKH
ncbi:MAG: sodium-independent anion transporter [Bacteroidetes bacterium HGW-Bacteroidetes-13]|nr:MAG: sodium-independent anion transporter [Bacteroidetes bacterium HGW-Bacteroidetes-13]